MVSSNNIPINISVSCRYKAWESLFLDLTLPQGTCILILIVNFNCYVVMAFHKKIICIYIKKTLGKIKSKFLIKTNISVSFYLYLHDNTFSRVTDFFLSYYLSLIFKIFDKHSFILAKKTLL